MSDEERDTQQRADGAETEPSILAALPRSRPQRSSPRRTGASAAKQTRASTGTKRAPKKKTPPPRRRREPPAPKQGYEALEQEQTGSTVHPPSGTELVESIATIFGELAAAGLKAGGRALKDALGPLRRP